MLDRLVTEGIARGRPAAWLAGGAFRPNTDHVSARARDVQFESKTDAQGYWTTDDGRWKAKEHRVKGQPRTVTLTDTTRRTIFGDTGASWTRLESWNAVRSMIAAHD